ncbi:YjzC family protein [Armatimonadetes bacterium]|nr:YjzC family protein [bacterium]
MTEYHTGELAPYSGSFKLLRHDFRFLKRLRKAHCSPKSNERRVPLSKGDPFPPCMHCNTNVVWNEQN